MAVNIYTGFFLSSLTLIYFAFKQYTNTKDLLLMGSQTTAKVIDLIESRSDEGYTYTPVFEYTEQGGQRKTYKSKISSSPPSYNIGDHVQIVYNKLDDEVKIISFWGLYRWSIILMMIASPIFVLTSAYLLYTRI